MKAIVTKIIGQTNTKPARIRAFDHDNNSVIVPFNTSDNSPARKAHMMAAVILCRKMQWNGTLVQGALQDGYVHVFLEGAEISTVV
jgi:hypothetical protein